MHEQSEEMVFVMLSDFAKIPLICNFDLFFFFCISKHLALKIQFLFIIPLSKRGGGIRLWPITDGI